MSHFTRMKTKLVDGDLLAAALEELDWPYERGAVNVRGWLGQKQQAEFRIPSKASGYDVGFVRSGDSYDLVADWWGVRGIEQNAFLGDVSRAYAIVATHESFKAQGFVVAEEHAEKDGAVRIVLRRMT